MSSVLTYLIKVNIAIVVLCLVYLVFFQRNTFHRLNRYLLLFVFFVSLLLPILNFSWVNVPNNLNIRDIAFADFEQAPFAFEPIGKEKNAVSFSWRNFFILTYTGGLTFLFSRFILQLVNILKRRSKYKCVETTDKRVQMYSGNEVPYTFLRWVFIPTHFESDSERSYILKHEHAHAIQLHSLDRIIAEIFCIFFWFNPFVFLLRRSLKIVHEYLADDFAASTTVQKMDYLQVLLHGMYPQIKTGISSNFHWSLIKKRIKMIAKNKTSKYIKFSYLLLIPVLTLIIQSFSIGISNPGDITLMKPGSLEKVPSTYPIKENQIQRVSSEYGMRMHPILNVKKLHTGMDFVAEPGTPIRATADGIVVKADEGVKGKGYGKNIIIKHGQVFATRYAQLLQIKVNIGDKVSNNQIIGLLGNSGQSTGPHLHYEVIKNGEHVNPKDYLGSK